MLDPQGPIARDIAGLWWGMLGGAAGVTLVTLALLALAFRRSPLPAISEGAWIKGLGIGFTMAGLAVVLVAGILIGERMQPRADDNAIRVTATARQWEWRFEYAGPDGQIHRTRDLLYIPAGQPVDVVVTTEDVIHAFWVPRLAGKIDAIPGHENILRLQADRPGRYHGRSAEFSGIGYGDMRFDVIAYDPAQPIPLPSDTD